MKACVVYVGDIETDRVFTQSLYWFMTEQAVNSMSTAGCKS